MEKSHEDKTIFRKKPSRFADSYVNTLWESSKRILDLGSSTEIRRSSNLSSVKDSRVLNPLLASVTKSLQKSMENYINPDDFILSLPPLLKLMQHLISVLKGRIEKQDIDTLLTLLTFTGSQSTENLGAKISALMTIIDTIVLSIYYLGETKEVLSHIYVKFIKFIGIICALPFRNLLRFSLGTHESDLKEANYEKIHFFEYVLVVVLSICKYHKISTDMSILAEFFEEISSFILTCNDFSALNVSQSYFVINNFTLSLSILYYGKTNGDMAGCPFEITENFKSLFIESIKMLIKIHPFDSNFDESFEAEMNPLAKLFNLAYQLFLPSKIKKNEQINGIVVVLFQIILQESEEIEKRPDGHWAKNKLRLYVMEFLGKFFFDGSEKNRIDKDLGIEHLVMNANLMTTLEPPLMKKWKNLFGEMKAKTSQKRVNEAILQTFESSCNSLDFLKFINEWLVELSNTGMKILELFIKAGIVEKLIQALAYDTSSYKDQIFVIISFCLNYTFVPNTEDILNTILEKIICKENMREYCELFLSKLLQLHENNIFKIFIGFFSRENDFMVFETLINALLKSLQDKNSLKVLRKLLPSNGLFIALEKKLSGCCKNNKKYTVYYWKKSFQCLEAFINTDELDYTTCTMNFFNLVKAFRIEEMEPYRLSIIRSTIKYLKHIVINKNYTQIKTPVGIPLLLEYFSYPELAGIEKFRIKFENMLKISNNFNNAVKFGLTSILLHNYDKENSSILWRNREKMISNAIECKFTYTELAELLKKIQTLKNPREKLSLLGILFDSLIRNDLNSGICSHFYFGYDNFLALDCSNEKARINLVNEFACAVWFYPEGRNNCSFFILQGNPESIIVKIVNGDVGVEIGNTCFYSKNHVLQNSWNLLVLNFKNTKVAKVLTLKKLTISLNGIKTKIRENSLKILKKYAIIKLIFSSQSESPRSYIGKIAWFDLFSRWLTNTHIIFIKNLTEAYSITSIPYTIKQNDLKTFQELKETLLMNCSSDSVYNLTNISPNISCDIFGGTSVFYVIQAYNPTRFIIELFEMCMDNEDTLIKAYEIVLRIILSIEKIPTICEQFFQVLSCVVRNSEINERINEILVMILSKIPNEEFKKMVYDSYLYRISLRPFKNKYLCTIVKLYKDLFPLSRENLYKFTQLLACCEKPQLEKYLKDYIGEDTENKKTEFIAYVLISLINKEDEDIIEGILKTIDTFPANFGNFTPISTVLLHILEMPFRPEIQILTLKCLCLKDCDDINQQKIMSNLVDEALKRELNEKTIEFLLSSGLENNKYNRYIRSQFVTSVIIRLPYIANVGIFDMVSTVIKNYLNNFKKYLKENKICEIWPKDFQIGFYSEEFKNFALSVIKIAKENNISISNNHAYVIETDSPIYICDLGSTIEIEEPGAKTPHAKKCEVKEDFRLISTYQKERAASLDKLVPKQNKDKIPARGLDSESIYFYKTLSQRNTPNISELTNYSENFKKIFLELTENSWLIGLYELEARENYKLQLVYNKYLNGLYCTKYVIDNNACPTKIRQVYDKYYRWALLKSDLPDKKKIGKVFKMSTKDQESYESFISFSTSAYTKFNDKSLCKGSLELIKVQGSYYGDYEITDTFMEVKFSGGIKPLGLHPCSALKYTEKPKYAWYIWYPSEIAEIIERRFIHKHTAIEIVLNSGKSFFLNFFESAHKECVVAKLKNWGISKHFAKSAVGNLEILTNDWKRGKMTNFEYLMLINRLAGRSMHDLSQYPIFPWVLCDYSSEVLKFDEPEKVFRNMDRPIGAQTKEMRNEAERKFKMWSDSGLQPFHFGSHYSNSGIITHFLLRIEPYTTQAKILQGGCFDVADRLFYSFELAWKSCLSMNGDVKELIPELFYLPFTLDSYSNQTFGCTQSKKTITHVEYPKWATSNWDFLKKHRLVLESPQISSELNQWIDLIFGYKQFGIQAKEALNIFSETTYEESFHRILQMNPKDFDGLVEQAYHFGQVPIQIFNKKHVKKDENIIFKMFDCFSFDHSAKFIKEAKKIDSEGRAHAIFVLPSKVVIVKSNLNHMYLVKYSLKQEKFMEITENELECYYMIHKSKLKMDEIRELLYYTKDIEYTSNTFALYRQSFLVSGMHPSNSLSIHTLQGKLVINLSFHTNLVTSVCCSNDLIFSASLDSTVASWNEISSGTFAPELTYYGHNSPVMCLQVMDSYQLLISSSIEGKVLIHDIRSSFCLKKISINAFSLGVSELGIIGICTQSSVEYYGINTEHILSAPQQFQAKSIKFNSTGDLAIEVYQKKIIIRDPTNLSQECVVKVPDIQDIFLPYNERVMYSCRNDDKNMTGVYIFRKA
ncbi:hypothetical protein SteCoe_20577 [Stentor coeruleus]|uniref:BEACH domain-containing protein n=1 Tax=Stentor coeruleus TaxID=5963 RepID=A0A1R2BRG7_9CILI|nr:hypothetical protein SteCoe_20577 [Stentor coeruleus]